MECRIAQNKKHCTCTYEPCSRKGICCECVDYHRKQGQIPGCFFTKAGERTYDRSIENFVNSQNG